MARPKGVPDNSDIKTFVWLARPIHPRKTRAGRLVWLAFMDDLATASAGRRIQCH